jgi:26S proteasome regulatory subunit N2
VRAAPSGFVLLRDLKPSEAVDLVLDDAPSTTPEQGSGSAAMAVEEEPQPPQAFEYTS